MSVYGYRHLLNEVALNLIMQNISIVCYVKIFQNCPHFFFFLQRKRKNKVKVDGQVNGVNSFDDDDEKLKQIAKQFEEKYVRFLCVS